MPEQMHFAKFTWKLQPTMQFGVSALVCMPFFKILDKRPVVFLYWFAWASIFSKCIAQLNLVPGS